ncbi:MAG: sensor histidine kinase [Bacteroidota bacterium]
MNRDQYTNQWEAFVRLLAHDIKGPVGNTMMFTEMVRDQLGQLIDANPQLQSELEMVRSMVANIETVNQKLFHQVQSWVEAHELQYGHMQWDIQEFKVDEVLEQLRDQNELYVEKKRIALEIESPKDLTMTFDPAVLERMLDTLLTLSVTYSEPEREIRISVEPEDKRVTFNIEDQVTNGRGEIEERLQWEGELTESFIPGNGVLKASEFGLIYIRKVCEITGGKVGTESQDDTYRTWFTLPQTFHPAT